MSISFNTQGPRFVVCLCVCGVGGGGGGGLCRISSGIWPCLGDIERTPKKKKEKKTSRVSIREKFKFKNFTFGSERFTST